MFAYWSRSPSMADKKVRIALVSSALFGCGRRKEEAGNVRNHALYSNKPRGLFRLSVRVREISLTGLRWQEKPLPAEQETKKRRGWPTLIDVSDSQSVRAGLKMFSYFSVHSFWVQEKFKSVLITPSNAALLERSSKLNAGRLLFSPKFQEQHNVFHFCLQDVTLRQDFAPLLLSDATGALRKQFASAAMPSATYVSPNERLYSEATVNSNRFSQG